LQVFLLQKEAFALQAAVDAGADMGAELETLKDQWFMKERMLRALATRNSIQCRSKIKKFRVKLKTYVTQKRRAARKLTEILSCTAEGKTFYQNYYLPTSYNSCIYGDQF
jgi:hypothetical protein